MGRLSPTCRSWRFPSSHWTSILDRAQSFAARFPGCTASDAVDFASFRALLREYQPDLLHILLPHHLHCPYAIAALEEGVNVLTEKPIAL